MIGNLRRLLLTSGIKEAMLGRSKPLAARRRFIPRLERLEERACPTIGFTPGNPYNLNRVIDNDPDDFGKATDNVPPDGLDDTAAIVDN
jgi:hypothetical protein